MKIIKIIGGSLAALWALGILFKLLRTLPFIFSGDLGVSRLLGAVAGLIIASVISYSCFKSAFTTNDGTPNAPQS